MSLGVLRYHHQLVQSSYATLGVHLPDLSSFYLHPAMTVAVCQKLSCQAAAGILSG